MPEDKIKSLGYSEPLEPHNPLPEFLCDVCRKNEAIGVACVPCMPVSVAYCRECLRANAHPYGLLVVNTAMCGGLEHTIEFWQQMVTDTCAHLGKTLDEFKAAVTVELANPEYADSGVEPPPDADPGPIPPDSGL